MTQSLPKGWRYDRLKDVAAINRRSLGGSTDPNIEVDYLEISNVNVLGIVDRSEIEHLRFADAPSRARRCVSEGATIISSVRPNLQAVAFIDAMDSGLICSTGFNVVEPIRHKLAPRYLYYYLLSDDAKQYFVATAKGVGYPAIDDKEFSTVDVPLPPLPEQKRIAAFLDAKCADIDKAIETKRKQLDCIDEMWKNILYKATTQGLGTARMVKTRNRLFPEIPQGWKIKRLKRICSMRSGDNLGAADILPEGEYPVYGGNGLRGYYSDFNVSGRFILVGRQGALCGNVHLVDGDFWATEHALITTLRPNIEIRYAAYMMDAMNLNQYASQSAAQPGLAASKILNVETVVPSCPEQCEIANYLDAKRKNLDELTDNLRRQIKVLADYRKSLIHECVMGERRVG